jgi:predicted lipoprotein with Yx(FWY)xxD motif
VATNPTLGKILTDNQGRTLYTYANDKSGTSTCTGQCAATWPPVTATNIPQAPSGASGTFSLITRPDGTQQLAYNGQPLYYYSKDTKPGDTSGQGVGGAWRVAQPTSSSASGG